MRTIKLISSAIFKSYQLLLGIWLTFYLTNHFSLALYGEYSAQISQLFIFGFILKLGFDVLVLKEGNPFLLFNVIIPTYLVLVVVGVVLCLTLSTWLGIGILSILLFSITLVLAELIRRKNRIGLYILMSGGLQYTVQTILFLVDPIVDLIGPRGVIFISVIIPCGIQIGYFWKALKIGAKKIGGLKFIRVKNVIIESIGQLFFNLSSVFNNWLGTYLLSLTGNMDAVAIFTAVKRITNGLSLPQQVLNINFANPLARSLSNHEKLKIILLRQRRLFFYTSLLIMFGGLIMTRLIIFIVNIENDLLPSLWTSYYILMAMVVINVLTGPTFIFTRISGGLGKKVLALNLITILCYGGAMLSVFEDKLLSVTIATFTSITLTNFYLMYEGYRERGVFLHARP